jgi:L-ascorbate metabolism protein UlaG (beta-lactamase superfamily)
MIAHRLFYPGDAWLEPGRSVEILALPVAGPWSKIRDSVEYAMRINPQHAFPVHDGMIKENMFGSHHAIPQKVLNENNIKFQPLKAGDTLEI